MRRSAVSIALVLLAASCGGRPALAPVQDFAGHDPAEVWDATVAVLEDLGFEVAEATGDRIATDWISGRDLRCGEECRPTWIRRFGSGSGSGGVRVVVELAANGDPVAEVRTHLRDVRCTRETHRHFLAGARESRALRVGSGAAVLLFDPTLASASSYGGPDVRTETRTTCGHSAGSTGRLERTVLDRISEVLAGIRVPSVGGGYGVISVAPRMAGPTEPHAPRG